MRLHSVRFRVFLRASMLAMLVLGLIVRPILSGLSDLHAAEHAVVLAANGHADADHRAHADGQLREHPHGDAPARLQRHAHYHAHRHTQGHPHARQHHQDGPCDRTHDRAHDGTEDGADTLVDGLAGAHADARAEALAADTGREDAPGDSDDGDHASWAHGLMHQSFGSAPLELAGEIRVPSVSRIAESPPDGVRAGRPQHPPSTLFRPPIA